MARLDAMVGHLATLARRAGDTDGVGVRRARALALLADPARACLMLAAGPAQAVSGTTVELGAAFGQLLEQQGPEVLRRLRPRTVLYVHLAAQTPLDAYEIPPSLAEVMELREPFEVFPWGTAPGGRADLDHTEPWCGSGADDRPGQTGAHNLGPLGRHHHRAKTFGSFRCYQPLPGLYVWRSPSGHWFRVDHTGTRALGRETPAILRQLRDPDPLSAGEQQLRGRIVHHLGA